MAKIKRALEEQIRPRLLDDELRSGRRQRIDKKLTACASCCGREPVYGANASRASRRGSARSDAEATQYRTSSQAGEHATKR